MYWEDKSSPTKVEISGRVAPDVRRASTSMPRYERCPAQTIKRDFSLSRPSSGQVSKQLFNVASARKTGASGLGRDERVVDVTEGGGIDGECAEREAPEFAASGIGASEGFCDAFDAGAGGVGRAGDTGEAGRGVRDWRNRPGESARICRSVGSAGGSMVYGDMDADAHGVVRGDADV